uniref:Plastid-encoded RNA polymerase subunit alpha n=1 Tax=Monomastix sp. (strain OKE-1) TaxID=141716 RepID=C0JWM7_MONSK|nr:alpha subunit of RNA polymerase [Monomastix sp. OKE-1]ACK36887.1 alpha subunit of RNA polymerase [Monomastix sp. OKE-1]
MDTELLEYRIEKLPFSPEDSLEAKKIQQVLGKNTFENSSLHYGKFYLSGLKKGQGITVANALRRVLLYDIMGLGITKVKFNSKNNENLSSQKLHEFSTISGIRESILELLMNLRLLVWTTSPLDSNQKVSGDSSSDPLLVHEELDISSSPSLTSYLGQFSLPEYFKSKDWLSEKNKNNQSSVFVLRGKHLISADQRTNQNPNFAQLINPEQYLATILPIQKTATGLSKFPEFEIEYKIGKGNLFENLDLQSNNEEFLLNSGPFFPVKKVNYTVEDIKNSTNNFLWERGFSECVFFEIWTDGSLHPEKALSQAFDILLDFFQQKD